MATLTRYVTQSTDDAQIAGGVGYSDSSPWMYVGEGGGGPSDYGCGWRFDNITLTNADTITAVEIQLIKDGNGWSYQADRWTFEASDDAATFSSGSPPGARPIVSTVVFDDHNTNHLDGFYYSLPQDEAHRADLAAALQEVLARPGWASGNAVVLLDQVDSDPSSSNGFSRKQWKTFDGEGDPTLVITYDPAPSGQFARPSADVSDGGWTDQLGGTTNLYDTINETPADDADYIISSYSPISADVCEIKLSAIADPISSSGHIVRYRYKKGVTGGDQINLTVRLMQGGTQIASWTHTDIADTFTTVSQTLSSGEADAITNYADLRLRFESVKG